MGSLTRRHPDTGPIPLDVAIPLRKSGRRSGIVGRGTLLRENCYIGVFVSCKARREPFEVGYLMVITPISSFCSRTNLRLF